MRTTVKRSWAAAGLAIALPFGLAACGDDKPSKEDVTDGMSAMLTDMGLSTEQFESMGVTEEDLDNFYTCIVDDIYDDVDAATLQKLADGDPEGQVEQEDLTTIETASTGCASHIGM